ncbi:metallophosphoesterase [Streptomyces sp. NBC_01218]|uniref:metallophosphoesterase family protein n=1 Tax=unclassified Streptomyces TaxID=2593676 RepID=UPI0023B9E83D|nr:MULTISPECIES: metallophosphoesterase [unclassified Streptomyces]WEH40994.1 metallophosphoesterase [Streptomyces sp. AM 2-1-1]WSQ52646.1 metallophosphoesterase [Streptomyces sp. NBC_01218]
MPVPELAGRRPRPLVRGLAMLAVVVLGAWLGLLVVGDVRTPVGPMDTTMALRPSLTGGTRVDVSPLGALELDSHIAPVRLDVDVDRLDPERSQRLVEKPERFSGLQDEVTEDIAAGARELAVRSVVAVLTGATALGLIVYRRPRPALAAGGLALVLLTASGVSAYATWNPKSVLEPKFSGLLSSAPSVVGDARSIVTEFDVYQQELARLVTNVSRLYDATSTLPVYQPDPGTLRVLHVSDIHLNPASWHIVASLVEQYGIDVIIDSGDTMDHGTTTENGFLDPVRDLGAPYVWVRGNHDSSDTQTYLRGLENAHVLDEGSTVTVAGLRIAGTGDPQFTPDRSLARGGEAAERMAGLRLASALRDQTRAGTPVDIAVAHDPQAARQTDGTVPLVLAGHVHHRVNEVLPLGTRLKVEGSTGGGGLRAVQNEKPEKVRASVLYLDRATRRLQAWDEITLGGLGLTTAEVSRHLPEENTPEATPSGTASPGSPTPATPSSPGSPVPAAPSPAGERRPSP